MSIKKRRTLIFGQGINDLDTPVYLDTDKGKVICPIYQTWYSMIRRCYSPTYHKKKPSYADCEVIDSWKRASNFKEWMITQDYHGKQLDKDLLVKGNRLYCPENCVFIDGKINGFLMDRSRGVTSNLTGVTFRKDKTFPYQYAAQSQNPFLGKNVHLGYYTSEIEAHNAWLDYKHQIACRYADMQDDIRVAKALRRYYKRGLS